MTVSNFYWDDSWLRAAAEESYRLALAESAGLARSLAKWRHVAETIEPAADGVAVGSPDAALLEGGARPHTIDPAGGGPARVLKFKDGGFASGPVSHPGFQGSPFMRPTAEAWPATYTNTARAVFPG